MKSPKKRCTNSKCRREFAMLNSETLWLDMVVCPYCGHAYPRITAVAGIQIGTWR